MSRSVDYLTSAEQVIYLSGHDLTDEFDWYTFKGDLVSNLQADFKSLTECDRWDSNEVHIFLENELAEIGLAEYNGLVSLSIRAKDFEPWYDGDKSGLAQRWLEQIAPKFAKYGDLVKQGTFSNGEAIFITKAEPWHTYSSKEGLCEWLEGET